MKRFIILLLVTISAGCASPTGNNVSDSNAIDNGVLSNKISKPTISTDPLSYLRNFFLGSFSKDELSSNLGVPDKTIEMGDTMYFAYELGEGEKKRQYVNGISMVL